MSRQQHNEINMVVKHNDLIQFSAERLTANENKLLLLSLSKLNSFNSNVTPYHLNVRLPYKEICAVIYADSGANTKELRRMIKSLSENLLKKTITIQDPEDPDGRWGHFVWITGIIGHNIKGADELVVSFNVSLFKYLMQLRKQYTSYSLSRVLKFKKTDAFKLYEIIMQYKNMPNRASIIFNIIKLRQIFGYSHKKADLLSNPEDIRRTLFKAKKDIEKNTEVRFTIETKKDADQKNIIGFLFSNIHEEEPALGAEKEDSMDPDKVIKKMEQSVERNNLKKTKKAERKKFENKGKEKLKKEINQKPFAEKIRVAIISNQVGPIWANTLAARRRHLKLSIETLCNKGSLTPKEAETMLLWSIEEYYSLKAVPKFKPKFREDHWTPFIIANLVESLATRDSVLDTWRQTTLKATQLNEDLDDLKEQYKDEGGLF